jgi:hypothetical protein
VRGPRLWADSNENVCVSGGMFVAEARKPRLPPHPRPFSPGVPGEKGDRRSARPLRLKGNRRLISVAELVRVPGKTVGRPLISGALQEFGGHRARMCPKALHGEILQPQQTHQHLLMQEVTMGAMYQCLRDERPEPPARIGGQFLSTSNDLPRQRCQGHIPARS